MATLTDVRGVAKYYIEGVLDLPSIKRRPKGTTWVLQEQLAKVDGSNKDEVVEIVVGAQRIVLMVLEQSMLARKGDGYRALLDHFSIDPLPDDFTETALSQLELCHALVLPYAALRSKEAIEVIFNSTYGAASIYSSYRTSQRNHSFQRLMDLDYDQYELDPEKRLRDCCYLGAYGAVHAGKLLMRAGHSDRVMRVFDRELLRAKAEWQRSTEDAVARLNVVKQVVFEIVHGSIERGVAWQTLTQSLRSDTTISVDTKDGFYGTAAYCFAAEGDWKASDECVRFITDKAKKEEERTELAGLKVRQAAEQRQSYVAYTACAVALAAVWTWVWQNSSREY